MTMLVVPVPLAPFVLFLDSLEGAAPLNSLNDRLHECRITLDDVRDYAGDSLMAYLTTLETFSCQPRPGAPTTGRSSSLCWQISSSP
jgi:hypothetical protein